MRINVVTITLFCAAGLASMATASAAEPADPAKNCQMMQQSVHAHQDQTPQPA